MCMCVYIFKTETKKKQWKIFFKNKTNKAKIDGKYI